MSTRSTPDAKTNVAIACQGGGSHTAFTAGVLKRLFTDWPDDYRLVGLSGASGGAICATAAWYGLLAEDENPCERLSAVWNAIAADSPTQRFVNEWFVAGSRARISGVPFPEVSPYSTSVTDVSQRVFRSTLEDVVDFDAMADLGGPNAPELIIGTVDINRGEFETFRNGEVTSKALLASAAVPELFEAVKLNDRFHWDGELSQNPPIDDLMTVDPSRKPEELWVIQISPQERNGEPKSLFEIQDRRKELSGNLSLNQELRFIERVNLWLDKGFLPSERFVHTTVRRIQFDETLPSSTKFDRSPEFIADLDEQGDDRARAFLDDLRVDRRIDVPAED
jgi:NTE family protein